MIYKILETGLIPEQILRFCIRNMIKHKLSILYNKTPEHQQFKLSQFINELKSSPIAIDTDMANDQHYQLPTEFFKLVLGPHLKYSCSLWNSSIDNLAEAEEAMLELYCLRAEISDGQTILDLGCGWGSMSLYLAKKYPHCQVTALSNSATQKKYIEEQFALKALTNLKVITADIVNWQSAEQYDRIVSIEMLEHMKNYELLFAKLSRWLKPEGKLFIHIFCHKNFAYHYHTSDDWLARYFFSGGTMPANNLFLYFQKDMVILKHWTTNGNHYKKTAQAWLDNMKVNAHIINPIFATVYGNEAKKWFIYWRVFFVACLELFGYKNGSEWLVSHYLFGLK